MGLRTQSPVLELSSEERYREVSRSRAVERTLLECGTLRNLVKEGISKASSGCFWGGRVVYNRGKIRLWFGVCSPWNSKGW